MTENRHKKQKRKRNSRVVRQKRRKRLLMCGLVLAAACLVVGITYAVLYHYVSGFPEDKICDNIYIGDCDVSGMTRVEAKEALTERLEQDKLLTVTLKVGEKHTVATLEELGIQCQKIDQCTKDAVEYGKTGSVWVRSRKIGRLKKEKKVFSCKLSLDQEQAAQVLEQRAVPLTTHAVDAKIQKQGDGFQITEEKEGETIDAEASVSKIEKKLNGEWDHEEFSVNLALKK